LGSALPATATAQAGRVWRQDEQALVTNFSELVAVDVGGRFVYALSPSGVISYDYMFGRWQPALTAVTGFPAAEQPSALGYDPLGGALWVGTATGALYSYSPGIERWERVTSAGVAAILDIVPYNREGALYLFTQSGWRRLRTGSFIADDVAEGEVPFEVRNASRGRAGSDPRFDAGRATIGLDPSNRRWQLTDVAPGERPGDYWVATNGGGLMRYDTRSLRSEWLPFGLLSYGAGAIALDGGRIWFGGDGRGRRNGVVTADRALQRWTHFDAASDGAPSGTVREIVPAADAIWVASSDGLFWIDRADAEAPGGRRPWRRFTSRQGLPSDATISVVPSTSGVWVATTRGVVRMGADGSPSSPVLLPGVRINRLAFARDTLWIAGDEGLFIVADGEEVRAEQAPFAANSPQLSGRVMDVVVADDAIYAIREDAYFRLAGGKWTGPERAPALSRLGRLGRAALADGALWLGGERGIGRLDVATGAWTYFTSPGELPPGPIRAILPAGDDVWIANAAGAFRFRWAR
jgi:ligand-binding sensor domain-containing protein